MAQFDLIRPLIDKLVFLRNQMFQTPERDHKQVDEISLMIIELLCDMVDDIPDIAYILETLTYFGYAPDLLYDDDGHWTVPDIACSPVCPYNPNDDTSQDYLYSVRNNKWCNTVREAVKAYLGRITAEAAARQAMRNISVQK